MNPLPHSEEKPLIEVSHLRKSFGIREVLADVSFNVPEGSIVSVLGRSGTGKSVLLKCIVGLLESDSGEVCFQGRSVREATQMRVLRQSSSYVFQQNALFDSSTVFENVLLPLQAIGRGSRSACGTPSRPA